MRSTNFTASVYRFAKTGGGGKTGVPASEILKRAPTPALRG